MNDEGRILYTGQNPARAAFPLIGGDFIQIRISTSQIRTHLSQQTSKPSHPSKPAAAA